MGKIMVCNVDNDMLPEVRKQRLQAYVQYETVLPKDHWEALKHSLSSNADSGPEVEIIVAKEDETLLGSVVLFPPNSNAYGEYLEKLDYPEIRMLAVSKEARGQGVATALITECIKRSKEKGFSSIGLHTGEFMKEAIALYEHFGFVRIPHFDFEPANDGIVVRAYILNL